MRRALAQAFVLALVARALAGAAFAESDVPAPPPPDLIEPAAEPGGPDTTAPTSAEPAPLPAEPVEPPRPLTPMEQTIENLGRTAFSREVLRQLYAARSERLLWTDASAVRELIAAVGDSEKQGLSPKAYGIDELEAVAAGSPTDMKRDVVLSRAFTRLAFDLRFGRVATSSFGVGAAANKRLAAGDNATELAAAIETKKVRAFLDRMLPPFALYQRLGGALEQYRKIASDGGWKGVDAGPTLRPGDRDRRVPQLRKRLAVSGDFAGDTDSKSDSYSGDVVDAVKIFQQRHGLENDGIAGRKTIEAMNVPASRRVDQIRATMERTRQFLHDLPSRFVVVNIASFSAYLIDNGQPTWSARVVVGKPELQTPVFRAAIESFIINPEWNVPPSIVQKELLPGLAKDPNHLAKMHIRRVGDRYVQESGAKNSLGRIKFNMPNEHAVYMHDTPSRNLFARHERAFSHGCVRVENPFQFAAALLNDPARDAASLEKEMQNGKTKTVRITPPVPVLVMTWSVVVAGDGRVDFLTDLYGSDDELLARLDGTPLPPKPKDKAPAKAPAKVPAKAPPAAPAVTTMPSVPPAIPAPSAAVAPSVPPAIPAPADASPSRE